MARSGQVRQFCWTHRFCDPPKAKIRKIENTKANRKVADYVKEIPDSVPNMGFLPFDRQTSFRTLCRFPRPVVRQAAMLLSDQVGHGRVAQLVRARR